MLAGLPDKYKPLKMAVENSGSSHKKSSKCFECNQSEHFAINCPKKKSFNDKPSKNEKMLHMSYVAKDTPLDEWYIDSGASAHMTMNRNSLISRSEPSQTEIIVGNNSRLPVEC